MAHILDGYWSSKLIMGGVLVPDTLPQIYLEIDEESGELNERSHQGTNRLTGWVHGPSPFTIEIFNEDRSRKYEGVLSAELPDSGGRTVLVISGKLRLNYFGPFPQRVVSDAERARFEDESVIAQTQDQIIWVSTKP